MRPAGGPHASDLVYAAIALVAGALTVVGEQFQPLVITAVVVALVPWALIAFGVRLPYPLFAALAIVPAIPVAVFTGIGASLFMILTPASRVASRSGRRWLIAALTVVVIAMPFVSLLGESEWDIGAIYFALGGAFSVLLGVSLRRSTELAEELRRADAELLAAAARDERHRIARDVHDLVAHSLTVVVLHVGGARRVLRSDPDAAEAALIAAERVSRESLDAIRGVVGLLREDGEPQLQSLDLERLVATYRSAGIPVTMRIDGDPAVLPPAVRVTLYRIVQEALANAARHSAAGSAAKVELLIEQDAVIARVSNELAEAVVEAEPGNASFGLVGLREQAASLGGTLSSGPVGDAWVVECRLPIGGTA
jgi:signal transduction histidine kinase